jgi:glucose/arabinose dehydrogenase
MGYRMCGALLALLVAAGMTVALASSRGAPKAQAAPVGLPGGFAVTSQPSGQAAGDLTDFDYLPDGSMITIGKGGRVSWVSVDGTRIRTLATLPVTTVQDLGLSGLAVAPDYRTSKAIYLARTMPGTTNNWPMRLSRFTVTGSPEPTGIGSELVLLHSTATADVHALTGVEAAPDDTLWVSVGDAADFRFVDPAALRALDVNDPRGKVLHIKGTDGTGVPGNPYYDAADPGAVRSKVYAMGFRSPFRLSIHQASGAPVLGDVGWNTAEEINLVRPGASYGWPCFEANAPTPGYRDLVGCAGKVNTTPLHSYLHTDLGGPGNSAIGGVVYTGSGYPATYRGRYFFGDYTSQRISTMQIAADGRVTRAPEPDGFGRDMGGPVSFASGPNGDIVYADIYDGTIKRISYTSGNRAPTAVATTTTDPVTRTVTFDGSGSYDLDSDPLTYRWTFGDGATGTGVRTSHVYPAGTGSVTATLTVTDPLGKSAGTSFTVAPGNHAPQLALTAPAPDVVFAVGDTVAATATATDVEDGAGLPVRWTTVAVHCRGEVCHDHPGEQFTGNGYTRVFEDHGDDTEQRVTATATDAAGVSTSKTFVAKPDLRTVTIGSTVPVTATINGVQRNTAKVTAGARVSVSVPAVASDGVSTFSSWSDGGAQAHDVVIGTGDLALTATYLTPIQQRYNSDPVLRAAVGAPLDPETGDAGVRWQDYANGRIYWSPATGVHAVLGAIRTKFLALGAHAGVGLPLTDELTAPDGVGRYSDFTNDKSIYFTPATGAEQVGGRIRFRWGSLGAQEGFLRYPATDELPTPDGIGRFNVFQGGSVYWSPGTDAWEVHGAIRDRWAQTGWELGPLGYPVTNETPTPDGAGRFNHFAGSGGGSIYWAPWTGAQPIQGAIRARWAALGWERSYLGYPTGGEFAIPGGRRSNFERGYITWNATTGQVVDRRY